ncbi:hypothetical protein [Xanthobacter versatilis]|uniref:hypothetical protein n=1 Tax=Xanthobacter autotrophicus (strain ATCC BAA-1158 / Py2) TaxID=78245 RepID=UPI003727698F
MTLEHWKQINDQVADAMLVHTRPFCTPLGTETERLVRLVGTGYYIQREVRCILLTCEHVAREQPMHYRFNGADNVFQNPGPWTMDKHPIDAAFAPINEPLWQACPHQAAAIPFGSFASMHRLSQPEELLFFRGYAGENARYAFGVHQTNASGYCTQEKKGTGDDQIFELFWEPENTQMTASTSIAARTEMKWEDARGFSGSLVWNTRYLEVTGEGRKWSPDDAVVTGLLRRWDDETRTLLVWRVEHLRAWLSLQGF